MVVTFVAAQGLAQPVGDTPAGPSSALASLPLSDALSGEAKTSYQAGKLLYGDGDFAGAALKFQHAYELSHDPRLLWNVLAAEKNLRHYARAEALLHAYLDTGGATLSESDRTDAKALLEAMGPFIASVNVSVNQPDASILIDELEVGRSPLAAPLRVDMGPRHLRVKKAGFKDFDVTQDFGGGTTVSVAANLVILPHEGRLRVTAGEQASIRIDGKLAGSAEWEGRLPSGLHTIEVSAPNKQTYRTDSNVRDNELTTVLVSLQDYPKATAAVPTWLWIAGGAVLAAGLGTGAYFLFKPEDKGPPPAQPGSLATWELPFGR